jgi:hypothetical protein
MSYLERMYVSRGRSFFSSGLRGLVFLFLLLPAAGCGNEEEKRDAIQEKVRAGDYEEAARWAHQYFENDKRILLVTLESIAEQQSKAMKEAYKRRVVIEDVQWPSDKDQHGSPLVVGRLINQGGKTITGFGLRIACMRDAKAIRETRALYVETVPPGLSTVFRQPVDGFTGCQDITIQIVDLGFQD